jgi:hypothetical protein
MEKLVRTIFKHYIFFLISYYECDIIYFTIYTYCQTVFKICSEKYLSQAGAESEIFPGCSLNRIEYLSGLKPINLSV